MPLEADVHGLLAAAYVRNHAPNLTFDHGSRVTALWLER
jgi:hypothetical protein